MSLQQCKVYSALINLALASNAIQKLWNRYYWSIKHLLLVLAAQSHALDRINKPLLSHSSGLFPREFDQKTVIFAWFMGTLIAWDVRNYAENRTRQTRCRKQFSRIIARTRQTWDSSILPPGGYHRAERLVMNNHLRERPWAQTPNQGKPQTNLQPPRSFRRPTRPPELLFPRRDPYSNYCRSRRNDSSPASWRFSNWTIACLWRYLLTGVCLT